MSSCGGLAWDGRTGGERGAGLLVRLLGGWRAWFGVFGLGSAVGDLGERV